MAGVATRSALRPAPPRRPAPRPRAPPPPRAAWTPPPPPADADDDTRRALLSFVQTIEANYVEHFAAAAPPDVVDALQQTVGGLVGTLPPSAFDVTIESAEEDVGQLLQATLLTGYMICNVSSRLALRSRLAPATRGGAPPPSTAPPAAVAAAVAAATAAGRDFAPGAQTAAVEGHVTKWHVESETPVRVDAALYVDALETELAAARAALAGAAAAADARARAGAGGRPNAVLGFLKTADAATLAALTADATPAVLEAGNAFVQRLVAGSGTETGGADSPRRRAWAHSELGGLLLFAGAVGFWLRTLEARADLEASLLLPPAS